MFLFLFFSMLLLRSLFRLKELFQVKNGLTTELLFFFFLKMPKIWVGWTTANREKKEDGLTLKYRLGAIELGNDLFKNLLTGFF